MSGLYSINLQMNTSFMSNKKITMYDQAKKKKKKKNEGVFNKS